MRNASINLESSPLLRSSGVGIPFLERIPDQNQRRKYLEAWDNVIFNCENEHIVFVSGYCSKYRFLNYCICMKKFVRTENLFIFDKNSGKWDMVENPETYSPLLYDILSRDSKSLLKYTDLLELMDLEYMQLLRSWRQSHDSVETLLTMKMKSNL
jgi:hypothetical protein